MLHIFFWVGFVVIVCLAVRFALSASSDNEAAFRYWGSTIVGLFIYGWALTNVHSWALTTFG